jgi:hypothetical protein
MNYFFAANFALLLGSIYTIRALAIQCTRDRPILAVAFQFRRNVRTEYRFFPDFFYSMGTIYTFLSGVLFLSNCIESWYRWGLFTMPDAALIGEFLLGRQVFYYLLAAIGLAIAFFILPDRTRKLKDARAAFLSFSLTWLSIAWLGIFLCNDWRLL